jgi:hypothetical protein
MEVEEEVLMEVAVTVECFLSPRLNSKFIEREEE